MPGPVFLTDSASVEKTPTNPLAVGGMAATASVSFPRTSDTNAYAANDVVGGATGSTAALSFIFANVPTGGADIMLTGSNFEIDVAAVPSGMTSFTLQLYSVTPPSALGDNVAWDLPSGDRASYLGSISLGTPADVGSTLYVEQNGINKQVKLASPTLFAYLVTVGGYTPGSATVFPIKLHAVAL